MHTALPARPNLRHALLLSMFALVLLGGAICANASTARASELPPTFQHFRDLATGFYLDSDGSGDVYTSPWNNGNYQRWQPLPSDYGTVNPRYLEVSRQRSGGRRVHAVRERWLIPEVDSCRLVVARKIRVWRPRPQGWAAAPGLAT